MSLSERETPDPPDGFLPMTPRGVFAGHVGPIFHRVGEDGSIEHAFHALARHGNGVGLVHGGMLSAFMDGLLGDAAGRATGKIAVTIHLSVDYLHMAKLGHWVRGEARVTRVSREVVFAEGRARVGRRTIVQATGIFKVMNRQR